MAHNKHWIWQYFNETSELNDRSEQVKKFQCQFCQNRYSHHAACIFVDHILKCKRVPRDLRDTVDARHRQDKAVRAAKSSSNEAEKPVKKKPTQANTTAKQKKRTSLTDPLASLTAGSFDPSKLTLSMFHGVQMPSVYEAGLISPEMKQIAIWYHEEVRKKEEEQEEKHKQDELLEQLGAVNGDPSTIDWSQFQGKIPSVYEASLISPQMKQIALWYHEVQEAKRAKESLAALAASAATNASLASTRSSDASKQKHPAYPLAESAQQAQDGHRLDDSSRFIQYWLEVRGEKYSRLLEQAVPEVDADKGCDIGEKEFATFFRYSTDYRMDADTAHIRRGHCCYILVDDTKLTEGGKSYWDCTFAEFLSAVFYIGKGHAARCREHLKQAVLFHFSKHPEEIQARCPRLKADDLTKLVPSFHNTKRLDYIKYLWDQGHGVTVFDGFVRALTDDEAHSLEAAMLMAFGAENMQTNRFGTPKAPVDQWGPEELTALGVHMLIRAYESFKFSVTHPHYERDFDKFLGQYVDLKTRIRYEQASKYRAARQDFANAVKKQETGVVSVKKELMDTENDDILFDGESSADIKKPKMQ